MTAPFRDAYEALRARAGSAEPSAAIPLQHPSGRPWTPEEMAQLREEAAAEAAMTPSQAEAELFAELERRYPEPLDEDDEKGAWRNLHPSDMTIPPGR